MLADALFGLCGLQRLLGLALITAGCGSSKANRPDAPDAGPAETTADSAGRCDSPPRLSEAPHCAGVSSQVLLAGDGDDEILDAPNDSLAQMYLFAFDDTCGEGRWTIAACTKGGGAPCVFIDSHGRNGELCGEYQDRSGTTWTLTELTGGLPENRTPRSASGVPPLTDLVVRGEVSAAFENASGEVLALTLSIDVCGPIRTRCCLC